MKSISATTAVTTAATHDATKDSGRVKLGAGVGGIMNLPSPHKG